MGVFVVAPPRLELGENCLWQFARRFSDESYAFYRETAGPRDVAARTLCPSAGQQKTWGYTQVQSWWLLPDSNWGHKALQASALPTELKSLGVNCMQFAAETSFCKPGGLPAVCKTDSKKGARPSLIKLETRFKV